ncbi:MAG: hypothetical protein K1X79_06265 [Oligoflexia bacterium]|nr:hypothetical protein [Oligoflexia bacterium]
MRRRCAALISARGATAFELVLLSAIVCLLTIGAISQLQRSAALSFSVSQNLMDQPSLTDGGSVEGTQIGCSFTGGTNVCVAVSPDP